MSTLVHHGALDGVDPSRAVERAARDLVEPAGAVVVGHDPEHGAPDAAVDPSW